MAFWNRQRKIPQVLPPDAGQVQRARAAGEVAAGVVARSMRAWIAGCLGDVWRNIYSLISLAPLNVPWPLGTSVHQQV